MGLVLVYFWQGTDLLAPASNQHQQHLRKAREGKSYTSGKYSITAQSRIAFWEDNRLQRTLSTANFFKFAFGNAACSPSLSLPLSLPLCGPLHLGKLACFVSSTNGVLYIWVIESPVIDKNSPQTSTSHCFSRSGPRRRRSAFCVAHGKRN